MVINIVMICDEGYVMPTLVAMTSIISNSKENTLIEFYIICDSLTEESRKRFCLLKSERSNISFIERNSENYSGLEKSYSKVSKASLLKFSIPELLCKIDKALYLDGDVIACKDLSDLYNIELGEHYAAVISDGPKNGKVAGGKKHAYYADPKYFNSGVMLLNLKKMRDNGITDKLIDFRKNCYNYFMDQDAFNCIFKDNVIHIDARFDFMLHLISYKNEGYSLKQLINFYNLPNYKDIDELFYNVYIFHYTLEKPWKFFDVPMCETWYKYYMMSPCSDIPLNRCSYLTTLIKSKSFKLYFKLINYLKKLLWVK